MVILRIFRDNFRRNPFPSNISPSQIHHFFNISLSQVVVSFVNSIHIYKDRIFRIPLNTSNEINLKWNYWSETISGIKFIIDIVVECRAPFRNSRVYITCLYLDIKPITYWLVSILQSLPGDAATAAQELEKHFNFWENIPQKILWEIPLNLSLYVPY